MIFMSIPYKPMKNKIQTTIIIKSWPIKFMMLPFLLTLWGGTWFFIVISSCVFFSIWTTHWAPLFQNFIFKCLHHHNLFNMFFDKICKAHCVQILFSFGLKVHVWLTAWLVFPTFQLSFPIFATTFWTWLGLPHHSIINILQCVCTRPINPMGIHLFCYTAGNRHMGTHHVAHDIFVAIAWNVGFHMGWEQLHVLPSIMFNFFCWQIDNLFYW
jgi:hypothetical protein